MKLGLGSSVTVVRLDPDPDPVPGLRVDGHRFDGGWPCVYVGKFQVRCTPRSTRVTGLALDERAADDIDGSRVRYVSRVRASGRRARVVVLGAG